MEGRSPESEKRRNKGKLRRMALDKDNARMCDKSAYMKSTHEMAKATRIPNEQEMYLAVQKERQRSEQYQEGIESNSPVKHVPPQ